MPVKLFDGMLTAIDDAVFMENLRTSWQHDTLCDKCVWYHQQFKKSGSNGNGVRQGYERVVVGLATCHQCTATRLQGLEPPAVLLWLNLL